MRVIAERARAANCRWMIRAVISDRADAAGLAIAADAWRSDRARSRRATSPDRAAYDEALATLVAGYRLSWSCSPVSCAFSRRNFIRPFGTGFSTSIPRCSRSIVACTRIAARSRRAMRVHGASVHFVTEELDGGPVIIQGRVRR